MRAEGCVRGIELARRGEGIERRGTWERGVVICSTGTT